MTTITQSADFIELTSPKGREISVQVRPSFIVVYNHGNHGGRALRRGRVFCASTTQEALLAAIDAYKTADLKDALRALLNELL